MIDADLTLIVRWTVFLTFVAVMLFGVFHTLWLGHRDREMHKTFINVDRRLKKLEQKSDNSTDSRDS